MLIQQVIKQQTLSLIDRILSNQSQQSRPHHQAKYSAQSYCKYLLEQKKAINQQQKQILLILIHKYQQVMNNEIWNDQNENQESKHNQNDDNYLKQKNKWFDQSEAYVMLKQIKRNIINGHDLIDPQKKSENQNIQKTQPNNNNLQNKNNQYSIQHSQPAQLINNKPTALNNLSKSLKKQNQFISRNINRIKSYSTQNIDSVSINQSFSINEPIPAELQHFPIAQQQKMSQQISIKLFHIYKSIYPSIIKNSKQIQSLNFQKKQQYKSTLDYHKILEIFVDLGIDLQIQKKLSILRIIKKRAFNQNFVTIEEWKKIYKSIIHNININEVVLQRLIKLKQDEKINGKLVASNVANNGGKYYIPLPKFNKNVLSNNNQSSLNVIHQKNKTRKIKTQTSIPLEENKKYFSLLGAKEVDNAHDKRTITINDITLANKSGIRPIGQSRIGYENYFSTINPLNQSNKSSLPTNPNQFRTRHKKLLTDVSEVVIKNMRKQLRSQKMIGLKDNKKQQNPLRQKDFIAQNNNNSSLNEDGKNSFSYLRKAINNKKISKITWQSLFQMKEQSMYHNIVIPEFIKDFGEDMN